MIQILICYLRNGGTFPEMETMEGNGECPLQRARGFAFSNNARLLSVTTVDETGRRREYNLEVMT